MWFTTDKLVDVAGFEPLEIQEVLHDLDGPRTLTFRNASGDLFFAHWCDEADRLSYFAVVPFSDALLSRLKLGDITVRDALEQPRQWILEISHDWRIRRAFSVDFSKFERGVLPESDLMLYAYLQPLFTLRAIGNGIQQGFVPSSVVKNLIQSAEQAIKVLVDYVFDGGRGRPLTALRRFYNLPTQRLAFNSFEISFRLPALSNQPEFDELDTARIAEDEETYKKVAALLRKGLVWATASPDAAPPTGEDPKEWVAIYKALENLSPSSHGPVSVVEVGGRLAEWRMPMERRYKLKPSVRPLIRYARDRISESRPDDVMLVGKIRELDRDRNSFELREIASGKPNQRFSYEDAFLEDVLEGIGSENRFRVIGTREGPDDPYSVLAIRRDDEVKDIAEPAS